MKCGECSALIRSEKETKGSMYRYGCSVKGAMDAWINNEQLLKTVGCTCDSIEGQMSIEDFGVGKCSERK